MTLRDYFAAKVLQGLCSNLHHHADHTKLELVRDAYLTADAMLEERLKS